MALFTIFLCAVAAAYFWKQHRKNSQDYREGMIFAEQVMAGGHDDLVAAMLELPKVQPVNEIFRMRYLMRWTSRRKYFDKAVDRFANEYLDNIRKTEK